MSNVHDLIKRLERDSDRADELENVARIERLRLAAQAERETESLYDQVHGGGPCEME